MYETARKLLRPGMSINFRDPADAQDLLRFASEHWGQAEVELIAAQMVDVNVRDKNSRTPLMDAAEHQSAGAVSYLIEKGADIHVQDKQGWSAFMHACYGNPRAAVVKRLLQAGADVNERTQYGLTPLMVAASHNSSHEVIAALVEDRSGCQGNDKKRRHATFVRCFWQQQSCSHTSFGERRSGPQCPDETRLDSLNVGFVEQQ